MGRTGNLPACEEDGVAPDIPCMARGLGAGLICYPTSGSNDGRCRVHLLLAPPFTVSDAGIDTPVARLAGAIDNAIVE